MSSMNGSVMQPLHRDGSCISEFKSTAKCLRMHLNNLWSIWYGILITALNGYIAFQCSKRFFDYADELGADKATRFQHELNTCIGLTGFAVLLIPFFFSSAIFKVGNLANDGFKLGRQASTCSRDPPNGILLAGSGCHRMWQHCGPTAPLFHLIIAFCLLLPKLIIEARLIQVGIYSKDKLWKTDLDYFIPHQNALVSLNFTTTNMHHSSSSYITTTVSPSGQPKSLPLSVTPGEEIMISDNTNVGSMSIEFINYALALFIYSVRYPSVFWSTNKYFGLLFSLQLLINSVQCLLMHAGVSILYKVHVIGVKEAIPMLSLRVGKLLMQFGTPFILNKEVSVALYVMSVVLILVSSLVLYLYGYGRLNSFLNREKARRVIMVGDPYSRTWGYFTHCAALCILVAIGVCEAPLLYDFTLIYRGTLDALVLTVILSSILHLFVWVLLWLVLTLKQHWEFKLRVTVGRATVRSAHSIKLVTEVQLMGAESAPLLVIGHGRTYTISEMNAKKAIMAVIQKTAMEKKIKTGQSNGKAASDDGEEQIYWLRPKSRTPRNSPDSSSSETRFGWFTKRKHPDKASVEEMMALTKHSDRMLRGEDNGDYVTLRELPGVSATTPRGENSDDTTSEDNKLLESVRNDRITYASVNKDLLNPMLKEYEDPSPLLTPEPHDHDDLPPPPPELSVDICQTGRMLQSAIEHQGSTKCLQRTDSGMPSEEIPSRSDSEVSGGSPPSRNSETSSGVHSNSSRDSEKPHVLHDSSTDKTQQWIQRNQSMSHPSSLPNHSMQNHSQQNTVHSPPPYMHNRVYKPQQYYAMNAPAIAEVEENTVLIRRATAVAPAEPFGRATNVRMTSFADRTDTLHRPLLSSTLPHFPTQPTVPYAHCSTMPLPAPVPSDVLAGSGSCSSFPRQHATIPTRLFNNYKQPRPPQCASHRTFPQMPHPALYLKEERDSANYSGGSSVESEPHGVMS